MSSITILHSIKIGIHTGMGIPIFLFLFIGCSFKAPGITFTQTQTVSEKQMVGEDQDIEKDGWLISSIKSSSSGSEIWQRDVSHKNIKDRDHLILLKKLAYLSPELKEYKSLGCVGESLDGTVKKIPQVKLPSTVDSGRLNSLLEKVNRTRKELLKIQEEIAVESGDDTSVKTLKSYYYNSVDFGEFYESGKDQWEKKE